MARTDWKRPSEFSCPDGRRRVGLLVSYNGKSFCGWQSQNGEISVQETIEKAVRQLTGLEEIEICGSGRTDSGVHAKGQVAHIEMPDNTIPAKAFCMGLNGLLPYSVRILKSWDAEPSFHARYSAMAREYRYFCSEGEGHNAFTEGLVSSFRKLPDIEILNSYAKCLIGTHDFTTFASAQDICPSKVRDIYESEFFYTQSMYGTKLLCYKICGNAFLYHMVRSLTGTMIEFALKGKTTEEFRDALNSEDRSMCGKTAPPDGLYLWRVSYDPDEYMWFEEQYGRH